MELCPICGITHEEQVAQEEFVSAQHSLSYARWKQRNNPNEPAPGLPVTDEYRVHYALWIFQNDPSKSAKALAQKAQADYDQVVKALAYVNSMAGR